MTGSKPNSLRCRAQTSPSPPLLPGPQHTKTGMNSQSMPKEKVNLYLDKICVRSDSKRS